MSAGVGGYIRTHLFGVVCFSCPLQPFTRARFCFTYLEFCKGQLRASLSQSSFLSTSFCSNRSITPFCHAPLAVFLVILNWYSISPTLSCLSCTPALPVLFFISRLLLWQQFPSFGISFRIARRYIGANQNLPFSHLHNFAPSDPTAKARIANLCQLLLQGCIQAMSSKGYKVDCPFSAVLPQIGRPALNRQVRWNSG